MSSPRFLFGVTSVAAITAGGVLLSGSAASAVPVSDITVGASPDSLNAYVTHADGNSVSVLDTANNSVVGSSISVGTAPWGIALSPTGAMAYVTNTGGGTVSVIDPPELEATDTQK